MRSIAFLVASAALLALAVWLWATRWTPERAAYPVQGVSLADPARQVDWATLRANGVDFAYVTASAGNRRMPGFELQWAAAHAAGVRRGAIHRFSACVPVAAQLRAHVTTIARTSDPLPAVLDIVDDPDCKPGRRTMVESIRAFLAGAEHHHGEPMILRVPAAVERDYAIASAIPRTLWAVRLFRQPDYLDRAWRLWQASDLRRIDGIDGAVEWSVVRP